MFTGIVGAVGEVADVEDTDGSRRIRVRTGGAFLQGVSPGESISVDGACLTPIDVGATEFVVDVIGTTLSRTVAGTYRPGARVNLERALSLGARLDGHLVQGHIDGVGKLMGVRKEGDFHLLDVVVPPEVHRLTLLHGSISLNGVSLTVNRLLDDDRVEVGIIPHTWANTNLRDLAVGDPLNVEGDLIGKYVGTLLRAGAKSFPSREGTERRLDDAGE